MLLLITAAGEGSRFRLKNIKTPKPLIRVKERTLLEHTLDSFNFIDGDQLIIAVQRAHEVPYQLDDQLKHALPQIDLKWIELETLLPGQLYTAVTALELSQPEQNQPLIIHNCDTGFHWKNDLLPEDEAYGSMAVFQAEGDHWSFGQPDPLHPNRAIAIAEKKRISNLASIGLYGFKSIELFLNDANKQLLHGETVKGEHYVAPLLQQAINQGKVVQLPRVDGVRTYGTPKELCTSFNINLKKLQADNY
tara:strand:- start:129 stop:875 length:747 start_codon:yes stop_codon:yes gene_type:complete